jgi:CheY-like chemotaxis protein
MSGYVICQKLKKDESLKSIPLVITSAEATPETFEKHKTLKVRAEDYLLKPFSATSLLASLGAFFELPEPSGEASLDPGEGEEELVALEEEAGIEALGGEPLGGTDLPALDLGSLPDDGPSAPSAPGLDDDLKLLDEAFEGLSGADAEPAPARAAPSRRAPSALDLDEDESPVAPDELDAAAASLPEEDDAAARAALGGLDMVADDALDALGGDEPGPSRGTSDEEMERDLLGGLGPDLGVEPEPEPELEPAPLPPSRTTVRGTSAESLRAAGIRPLAEKPPAPSADTARLERELSRKDQRIQELEDRLSELERRAEEAERRAEESEQRADEAGSKLAAAESQAAAAKARIDAAQAQARRHEADLKAARDEASRARQRAEKAEGLQDRVDALERELEDARTDLTVAKGDAEAARADVDKRTADLRKQVQDLQAQASKNEERVVKAYLKIKNDEKVREKTKKALQIAAQLLDEGVPPEPSSEKPRSAAAAAAAALGREQ